MVVLKKCSLRIKTDFAKKSVRNSPHRTISCSVTSFFPETTMCVCVCWGGGLLWRDPQRVNGSIYISLINNSCIIPTVSHQLH